MKLLKILGVALVFVGLVTVGAVYAPRAFGQSGTVVRVPSDSPAIAQVFVSGGGHIGVSIRDVDKADIEREKLAGALGAVIEEVRSGSPAEKAGLKSGDVVIEYDGDRVRSARQLTRLVSESPEGRTVKAAVMRAGKRVDVEITPDTGSAFQFSDRLGRDFESLGRDLRLKIQPELDALRNLHVEPPLAFEFSGRLMAGRLGVSAQDLTPQLADYFGVKEGVLVSAVTVDSVAAKAGLKAGDVIVAVDGKEVTAVSKLRRALAGDKEEKEARKATLTIVRDKREQTVAVELEPPEPVSPRRVTEMVGPDPEEMQELATEAQAHAKEYEVQAQEWQKEQKEFQKEQKNLQEELWQLQEELPKEIEEEIEISHQVV